MRTYAIGDVHGHFDQLTTLHSRIAADQARYGVGPVVHVGDLVDRGPDSQAVIEYLRAGIAAGRDWIVLKGNHDRMFTNFLTDYRLHDEGLRSDLSYLHPKIGGGSTLASYGVQNAADRPIGPIHAEAVLAVPEEHRAFLQSCPTKYQRGDVVYVHAGIRPGIALIDQTETDLMWIRGPFLTYAASHGPLIVHGHTVVDAPMHYGNRVNIDSGAAYGGPLSAIVIEGRDVFHLTENGRMALLPHLG